MVGRPGPDFGPGITASEGRGQVPVRARRRLGRDVRVTIMASSADLDAADPASDTYRGLPEARMTGVVRRPICCCEPGPARSRAGPPRRQTQKTLPDSARHLMQGRRPLHLQERARPRPTRDACSGLARWRLVTLVPGLAVAKTAAAACHLEASAASAS